MINKNNDDLKRYRDFSQTPLGKALVEFENSTGLAWAADVEFRYAEDNRASALEKQARRAWERQAIARRTLLELLYKVTP